MSSYRSVAKNPQTKRWEPAEFLDDFFDKHEYGIRFTQARDNLVVAGEKIETMSKKITVTLDDLRNAWWHFSNKFSKQMENDLAFAEFLNCLEEVLDGRAS